jgi:lysozyme family protein
VDYSFFDTAVLEGPYEASLFLQRALSVPADGHIGVITLNALRTVSSSRLVVNFAQQREAHFAQIVKGRSTSRKYLAGWDKRAERVEHDALKMIGAIA